jgi:hypothetical protein
LQIPSGVKLSGGKGGKATVSGAVGIGNWQPAKVGSDERWLFRAPLPPLLRGKSVNQLWVASQRHGAARSPTMVFANVTATGLQAAPG